MPANHPIPVGIMFRRSDPPALLPAFAQAAEAAGYASVWVVEDCFYSGGGIAGAATALACTERLRVGLGIMPAVARNPVFSAMEIATLAHMFPGRFVPGIGHGVEGWMRQIGAYPASPLTALEEVVVAVRALLRGEMLNTAGQYVRLDQAQLIEPPARVPPVLLGVRGAKSLALSGRVADGTVLAECSSPAYVTWAREQIAIGARQAGRAADHRVVVFAMCRVDPDRAAADAALRPAIAWYLSRPRTHKQIVPMGIVAELVAMLEQGGIERLAAEMPEAWLRALTIGGTPDDGAEAIRRLAAAGADEVVLVPVGTAASPLEPLETLAAHGFAR